MQFADIAPREEVQRGSLRRGNGPRRSDVVDVHRQVLSVVGDLGDILNDIHYF